MATPESAPLVGIVGAGAAGLLAAHELVTSHSTLHVVIFEQGATVQERTCPKLQEKRINCAHCQPCNIMAGVGGAGTWSSGILNLSPRIGGDLVGLAGSKQKAWEIIREIDDFFVAHGAPEKVFDPATKDQEIQNLKRLAASVDVRFVPIKQRLMGTENAPRVIKNVQDALEATGRVTIRTRTHVRSFSARRELVLQEGGTEPERASVDYLIIAPGRVGMQWLADMCQALEIPYHYGPLDIGVRVEVPAILMDPVCSVQRDPKFHIYSTKYDDFLRTFCVNHEGYVVQESYHDGIVGVNGDSYLGKKSENTNFALLDRVTLTEPLEDSTAYGHAIAKQTTVLGGKKPLLQTLGDLRRGRRSTPGRITKNHVQPTLLGTTPGDLAMAYPHRLIENLLDGLARLDHVVPGIANDSTLLYAPEVKYSAYQIKVNRNLETPLPGIFVAGDGAGLSRGIVGAALTGILAARGILEQL